VAIFIGLITWLVLIGIVWWLVGMLPLPAPIGQIINIVFIIFLILLVLSFFGVVPGFSLPRLHF